MRIYHAEGLDAIERALSVEGIKLSEGVKDSILDILGKIGNYEEEETKILPKLLLGRNMNNIFLQIPDHFKVVFGTDEIAGLRIKKILKSLIPICRNGWYVFIDINEDEITYGIFRKFRSPVSLDFEQLVFDDKESFAADESTGMIYMYPNNRTSFIIRCLHTEDIVISSGFKSSEDPDEKGIYDKLIDDIMLQIEGDKVNTSYLRNAMSHLFFLFKERIHGAIILIVNEDYLYPNTYLDGLVLKPCLNIIQIIEESKTVESYETAERYYALTNLLYEFLNIL